MCHSFLLYFISLFIYLFIYLFNYLFLCLFIYLFIIYLFLIYLFIYSFIYLFIYLFIHLSIYLFILKDNYAKLKVLNTSRLGRNFFFPIFFLKHSQMSMKLHNLFKNRLPNAAKNRSLLFMMVRRVMNRKICIFLLQVGHLHLPRFYLQVSVLYVSLKKTDVVVLSNKQLSCDFKFLQCFLVDSVSSFVPPASLEYKAPAVSEASASSSTLDSLFPPASMLDLVDCCCNLRSRLFDNEWVDEQSCSFR